MFPTVTYDTQVQQILNIEVETTVKNSLEFNFVTKTFSVVDGNPVTNADIAATEQWITLFMKTDKDCVPVYKGTKFGTSIRKLFGYKALNNGFYESEIEREIKEGFAICPTIRQVTAFNMSKSGKYLVIDVSVQLQDGTILNTSTEVTTTLSSGLPA